jgi:hypothetical protein
MVMIAGQRTSTSIGTTPAADPMAMAYGLSHLARLGAQAVPYIAQGINSLFPTMDYMATPWGTQFPT